jgi:hypothetical protein
VEKALRCFTNARASSLIQDYDRYVPGCRGKAEKDGTDYCYMPPDYDDGEDDKDECVDSKDLEYKGNDNHPKWAFPLCSK